MITREEIVISLDQIFQDVVTLIKILTDKGIGYFGRPLLIAGACLAAAFFLIYKKPANSLDSTRKDVADMKMIAQYTSGFQAQKELLQSFYANLPKVGEKDRGIWLTEIVRKSIKTQDVFFDTLTPVSEDTQGSYIQETVKISCRLKYSQLAAWIASLEKSSRLIRISQLSLRKDRSDLGLNQVELTVTAIFPKAGNI